MSNLSRQELYETAYSLHYKDKLYEEAYAVYSQIIERYPDSREASYSKTQIDNITNIIPNIAAINDSAEQIIEFNNRRQALNRQNEHMSRNGCREVIITSGYTFEGFYINKYIDYISYEIAVGVGGMNALLGNIAGVVGTESDAIRGKLSEARNKAIFGIKQDAIKIGANAIIGLKIDYETFYETLLLVIVSGTAVDISAR